MVNFLVYLNRRFFVMEVKRILCSIVITLVLKRELVALLFFCDLCIMCHDLCPLPLGVIDRLRTVIVAIPGHIQYYRRTSIA